LAVLFARSYARAEEIHRAMLARGFPGYFRPLTELHFHPGDVIFLAIGVVTPVALRVLIESVA
jgi:energy-coupling factor transporter transmembrane protein EcfT